MVYKKILEFYKVAFDILTRKGVKLIMKMVMENDRLPSIVQDFLKCADILHKLIEKSVLRITQDIQAMLYHSESELPCISVCDINPYLLHLSYSMARY